MCEDESPTTIQPSGVYLDESQESAMVTAETEHSLLTTSAGFLSSLKKSGCKRSNNGHVLRAETSSSPATERITRMGSGAIKFKSVHDMCQSAVLNRSLGCEALSFRTCGSRDSLKKARCKQGFGYERSVGKISSALSKTVVEKPRKKIVCLPSGVKDKTECNKLENTGLKFTDEQKMSKRKRRLPSDEEEIAGKICADGESGSRVGTPKYSKIESHVAKFSNFAETKTESSTAEISQGQLRLNSEAAANTNDLVRRKMGETVSTVIEDLIPQTVLTDRHEFCVTEDEYSVPYSPNVAKYSSYHDAKRRIKDPSRRNLKLGPRNCQNFRCGTCKLRFFETEDELKIHLECHDGGPDDPELYRCKVCDYSALTWNRILSHIVAHNEYKMRLVNTRLAQNLLGKFACPRCEQCFERKVNMQNHLKKVHSKESHTCDQCGITLNNVDRKTFVRHQEKCRNVKIHCNHCQYTTNVRSDMQKHMKVHNGEGLTCSTCSAVFPTRQRFRVHLLTHQVDRPRYECEYCGMMFLSEDAVKKHCTRFHQNSQLLFPCTQCEYVGRIKVDLKKHVQSVHEKKNKCPECSFSTNSEQTFEQHKAFHAPDCIFGCSVASCFYRASSAKQLLLHTKSVHHTVGKHQCPVCQKSYKKKTHLLRHLVSHTGDRPYVCQECGQTFFSHSSYYRHRRRLGHDENREGVASVPQNITIQYLDGAGEKQENAVTDNCSINPSGLELLDSHMSNTVHVFPATFYEHLLQTAAPRIDLNNMLSETAQDLLCETKCEDANSLITYVVEVKQNDILNRRCLAISEQCIGEEQDNSYPTQNGSVENLSLIEVAKDF